VSGEEALDSRQVNPRETPDAPLREAVSTSMVSPEIKPGIRAS